MANENLKPCPFCGSSNLQGPNETEYIGDSYYPLWWIECQNCPGEMSIYTTNPQNLINAWNLRNGYR